MDCDCSNCCLIFQYSGYHAASSPNSSEPIVATCCLILFKNGSFQLLKVYFNFSSIL